MRDNALPVIEFDWLQGRRPETLGTPFLSIHINTVVGHEYLDNIVRPFFKCTGSGSSRNGDYVNHYDVPITPEHAEKSASLLWLMLDYLGKFPARGEQFYQFFPSTDISDRPVLDIKLLPSALAYLKHCSPIGRDRGPVTEAVRVTAQHLNLDPKEVKLRWYDHVEEFRLSCELFRLKRYISLTETRGEEIYRVTSLQHDRSLLWTLPLLAGLAQIRHLYLEDRFDGKLRTMAA